MDTETLKKSLSEYKQQLHQINLAISVTDEGPDKNDLISLKSDIEQLIELTEENLNQLDTDVQPSTSKSNDPLDDEYLLFMQEMEAEGVESNTKKKLEEEQRRDLEEDLKSLEGMKCQAPHIHSWGDTTFHNALVCAVLQTSDTQTFNDIQVRVMYTNPTHREMLPCPYFLEDSNCKFSDEQCRFSHGEIVPFSSLREYKEPNFEALKTGSRVLVKSGDKLWHRAIVRKVGDSNCCVKFENNKKEASVAMHDLLPLENDGESGSDTSDSEGLSESEDKEIVVQKSLLNTPSSQALGDWEKHTKGIGSKLMQQMGYVIGTGLGRFSDGRIDPVEAVVLPSGKSLDHCMNLRELAGGDETLFSAERKLKKQQKRQEAMSKKVYEREKNKKDVFEFLNNTLSKSKETIKEGRNKREELKSGSTRDLNVTSLKIDDDMKKVEVEMYRIQASLNRHSDNSVMHNNLKTQLANKQRELDRLKDYARNVRTEQNIRKDKKKLTVF